MVRFFFRCAESAYLYLAFISKIEEQQSFYIILFCILLFIDVVVIGQIIWQREKTKLKNKSNQNVSKK
jgi:hypothetical protein